MRTTHGLWMTAAILAACSGNSILRDDDSGAAGDPGSKLKGGSGPLEGFGGSGAPLPSPPIAAGPPLPGLDKVVSADKPPVPLSGGTLTVTANGRFAVAADPERDQVSIVKLVDGQVKTVALRERDEPGRVVEDAAGRVHVALRGSGDLVTLAVPSGDLLARRAVCGNPRGLAFDAAAGAVHVACAEGRLVTLSADPAGAVTRDLRLDSDLRDVVVSGDRLFVSRFRSADVLVLKRDGSVERRVRPADQASLERFSAGSNPPPGFGPKSASVAWRLAARRDGSVVMLHQAAQDSVIEIQPGGYAGKCAGIVGPAVTTFPADGAAAPETDMRVAQAGLAVDVAVSPGGTFLAVAGVPRPFQRSPVAFTSDDPFKPTNPMETCNPPMVSPPSDDNEPVPETPEELPEPDVYAPPAPEVEVVAVAFDRRGNLLAQAREPARLLLLTQRRSAIVLSNVSREDTGHRVFHAVTFGGVACASCHPEGGDDGRVWTFHGIGARRTQTMRGGITQTAPFHWDGDMKDLGKLMTDVFMGRMGGPQLGSEHTAALGKFLDAIPMLSPVRAANDAAAQRGKALFTSTGCETCHTGPSLTNNMTVDVGTGKALQVPTLRGLSHRLPLMHSGCAKTIAARFDAACGGGDRHGVTSTLTTGQLADLTAFLEAL